LALGRGTGDIIDNERRASSVGANRTPVRADLVGVHAGLGALHHVEGAVDLVADALALGAPGRLCDAGGVHAPGDDIEDRFQPKVGDHLGAPGGAVDPLAGALEDLADDLPGGSRFRRHAEPAPDPGHALPGGTGYREIRHRVVRGLADEAQEEAADALAGGVLLVCLPDAPVAALLERGLGLVRV